MGLFSFNKQKPTTPIITEQPKDDYLGAVINLKSEYSLPKIVENRNTEWVPYGVDNMYPSHLEEFYLNSPTHQAIVDTKATLVAGNGFTYDDSNLTEKQKIKLSGFLNFIDGKNDIETFIRLIAKDQELYGAISIETVWSLDFQELVKINRVNTANIRSGKFEDGHIDDYFYKRNWADRKEDALEMSAFDISNKEDLRQLLYLPVQMTANEYYGEPQYLAGINWIDLEGKTGLYYKSLLDNGFNPSIVIKYYKKPASMEAQDDIVTGLKKSFGGVKQSGKAMVMFSDGKELAPDVQPIDVQNVDKQFIAISEQITEKILTSHRVPSGELLGIAIPGKLGTSDFATQVEAFQKFVIAPNQNKINQVINKLLRINGLDVNFKITPFELESIKTA